MSTTQHGSVERTRLDPPGATATDGNLRHPHAEVTHTQHAIDPAGGAGPVG